MDLRTKKTRRAIREAFLHLRAKKPLERITVKELAELAEISKATFYLHYQDIYDLSQQLQRETVEQALGHIPQPEEFLENPMQFMQDVVHSFSVQREVTQVLFSGTQSSQFPALIEEAFLQYYSRHFPNLEQDAKFRTFLTYQVYGSYYAFTNNVDIFQRRPVLEALHDLSKALFVSEGHHHTADIAVPSDRQSNPDRSI